MIDKQFSRLRAIVVDDDYNTVRVFSELLELTGMKIVGKGYDGVDAVELYRTHVPDIVFLDAMMRPQDGFYALEQIRQINDQAIVIMVTSDLRADTADRLGELRASSIIYKPFDITQILEIVEKLIVEKLTVQILLRKHQTNRSTHQWSLFDTKL